MSAPRRIAVVTGSRADYGLLRTLMRAIADDSALRLQPIVTGMHLDSRFGDTAGEIDTDGFSPDARVAMDLSDDSPVGTARAVAQGTIGMAEAFARLRPDIAVMLGDRFEILAAAQAAMLARVPIAHIHGGETTEGAFDEAIRHAVTKMAHLHFVAAEPYRRRVIQLGESPERVFTVGAPGLDNITALALPGRADLDKEIGFPLGEGYLLVTCHPVTLADDGMRGLNELLAALDAFPERRILFTGVNADPGNRTLAEAIDKYVAARSGRAALRASLGSRLYLAALKHAAAVVGNSSSGLVEAPALGTPTVNIGDRQRGRLRADSVIDCPEDRAAIIAAIHRASAPHFRAEIDPARNPYGVPGASRRIRDVLRDAPLGNILIKHFHDLKAVS